MEHYINSHKVYRPCASIATYNAGKELEYYEGEYTCNKGVVYIYADPTIISLSFVFEGRYWMKTISEIKKKVTYRLLARQAGIFVKEVTKDPTIFRRSKSDKPKKEPKPKFIQTQMF